MVKRILVLDDNPDILDIVKEALLYENFEVKVSTDSKNFIGMVNNYRPDLLILDYKLNGPKGDDICRQIKTHHLFNNIPVIICSAYLNSDEFADCGCDATIAKPFGLAELVDKVNGLVCS
ncbi:response regulator [Mucilaginibacter sp.]|uniref:response regulator transcription factor n=1 Tax=Mucilaginibacter sp. TaxID=1882438 RepID=UPI002842D7B3|nr:response regulator [Mucilaginibacter sp.]MDR3694683.1 response regulator [Mucilaginibacter sp.]